MFSRPSAPLKAPNPDEMLVPDIRLMEKRKFYQEVERTALRAAQVADEFIDQIGPGCALLVGSLEPFLPPLSEDEVISLADGASYGYALAIVESANDWTKAGQIDLAIRNAGILLAPRLSRTRVITVANFMIDWGYWMARSYPKSIADSDLKAEVARVGPALAAQVLEKKP